MVYSKDGEKLIHTMSVINVAASNSNNRDKEIADYVCTGTNDNLTIQNIIDGFGEHSGIINFAVGTYNFDTFVKHDGFYYGLYFPKIKREIILRGAHTNHKAINVGFAVTGNAAVFNVTSSAYSNLPSNAESCVIGAERNWEFPYNELGIEYLTITVPNNTKPVIGIDGYFFSEIHVEKSYLNALGDINSYANTNPKSVAIRGCQGGNTGFDYYFKNNKIIGWGTAFQIMGEHLVMEACIAQRCLYGYIIGYTNDVPYPNNGSRGPHTGIHPHTIINCASEGNINAVHFSQGSQLNTLSFIDFNMELYPLDNPYHTQHIFTADDNSPYLGSISYLCSGINWDNVQINAWDSNDHAKKFKTIDLTAPLSGTTANRPTAPVYLSQYFDTTLNQMLTWNGTNWV